MNQNFNFSRQNRSTQTEPSQGRILWLATVLFAIICNPGVAQGQVRYSVPPPVNSPGLTQPWTPPSGPPATTFKAPLDRNQFLEGSSANSFPEVPVAFMPGNRIAKLEAATSEPDSASLDSTIDSTAAMLSGLSDSVGEKANGWLASLQQDGGLTGKFQSLLGSSETGKMLGSLALVLGLYFAFVWVMRKINPGGNRGLPPEVISVMGQIPFGPRRNLQLVRLGSKLLLLMNSPEGTQPLGEITDSTEVEYLSSLCPGKTQSKNDRFNAVQHATQRLADAASPPSAHPRTVQPNTNLTQVIKILENAAKQGGAVFEA